MDSKKSEVKNYIGDNNLDVDKEDDLIKVVTYFDTLL
jgi:intein-encoded DNA endonuclease-like protein